MNRLRPLLPLLRPHRLRVAAGLGAILCSAALGLAAPLLIGAAVDAFLAEVTLATLVRYALLLIAVTAVQGVFSFAQRLLLVTVSRDVEYAFRQQYFLSLTRQPLTFFQQARVGDLMARATNDLQAVRMICGPAIMYSANTLFTGLGALFFMLRIHPGLTGAALVTMPLVALATQVIGQRVHTLFDRVQSQFADLSTSVQENLAGVRVVRAYAREEAQVEHFRELNREYVDRNRRLARWSAASRPLIQLLVGFGFVVALGGGGLLAVRGAISVGEFVSFNFFLGKLVWPMIAIGWVINLVQRGAASLARLREVAEREPEIREPAAPVAPRATAGEVEVIDLTFSFPAASRPVLSDVELRVAAGETVAFVGRTGAGKSTLLSLIPRLLDPEPGRVRVDGVDVREWSLEELRRRIGVVPQETFLFSTTVRENILMASPEATPEALEAAVRTAGLDDDVLTFPNGLETLVGERGITLSGGQKQRVALARALLSDPRILILDDCLSAVDTRTEERILSRLESVFATRTVLLVSHRISTVRQADRIVVLERGRVSAVGTHRELVEGGGLYADLDRRQRLEDELAAV